MVIRGLAPYLRSLVELAGIAALVIAAFAVDIILGIAALGVGLILVANFAGRPPTPPARP